MRATTMRAFTSEAGFTPDFFEVRDFLLRINADEVRTPGFLWARWEWAFALPFLDTTALDRIGVWREGDRVVGLATYEQSPGDAWLVVDPARRDLLPDLVDHAVARLARGALRVLVPEDDAELAALVAARGLEPSDDAEPDSVLDLDRDLDVAPPDGFDVIGLDEPWDLRGLHRLMHRGFGHQGEPDYAASELDWRLRSTTAPDQVPELQVVVRAADGRYAAFAGTWLWPGSGYALVEPVCTDPDFRRLGCGRAAVLEALRRCRERGARQAYVGSDQEFYRSMGFEPAGRGIWWETRTR